MNTNCRLSGLKDAPDLIDFQRDFVEELAKESDYGCSLDVSALFKAWQEHKGRYLNDVRII